MSRHDHELRLADWFCGAGGSTQGIATIPGVRPVHAANHWAKAIESHAANDDGETVVAVALDPLCAHRRVSVPAAFAYSGPCCPSCPNH